MTYSSECETFPSFPFFTFTNLITVRVIFLAQLAQECVLSTCFLPCYLLFPLVFSTSSLCPSLSPRLWSTRTALWVTGGNFNTVCVDQGSNFADPWPFVILCHPLYIITTNSNTRTHRHPHSQWINIFQGMSANVNRVEQVIREDVQEKRGWMKVKHRNCGGGVWYLQSKIRLDHYLFLVWGQ